MYIVQRFRLPQQDFNRFSYIPFVCVTSKVQRVLIIQIRVKLRSFSFVLLSEHDQSAFLVRFPARFDPSLEEFFGFMECSQIGLLKEKTNLTKAIEWTSKKTYLVACLDHTSVFTVI